MANWMDESNRQYIASKGYKVRDDGIIVLTKEQFANEIYTDVSIWDGVTKTWMIPYCTLLIEGKNFVIE